MIHWGNLVKLPRDICMPLIQKVRFEALAGYCRLPQAALVSRELEWHEYAGERILGIVILDLVDREFGGILLARDERERFRWIGGTTFFLTIDEARDALHMEAARLELNLDNERRQGDGRGEPVDFFAARAARDRLNPGFLKLAEQEGFSPARGLIEPMMRWYEDLDGNFIEQFQTTGFDARIWELYLFATFVEAGYAISSRTAIPDFSCSGLNGELCVEATTVNPTAADSGAMADDPPTDTAEQMDDFLRNFMPIKFAGPLTAKLRKKYWEKPHVSGKPLLFAIQDFHAPMAMLRTRSALPTYLYGYAHDWNRDADGRLRILPRPVVEHRWGTKVIPSGFFAQEGAENISAVLFSNCGTISKFNRIGVIAGFGSRRVRLVRHGLAVNHDPNASEPTAYARRVHEAGYSESWVEGLDVFHNPGALHPIDPTSIPGAAHHRLLPDGQIQSRVPAGHTLASVTMVQVDAT